MTITFRRVHLKKIGPAVLLLLACTATTLVMTGQALAADSARICTPSGVATVVVKLKAAGERLAGVKVVLDYPEDAVTIPGFENRPEVRKRVSDTPAGFLVAVNDTDTELIVALAGTAILPEGAIFTVAFDLCRRNVSPEAGDFHCKVQEASDNKGKAVDGATCTVGVTQSDPGHAKTKTNKKKAGGSR